MEIYFSYLRRCQHFNEINLIDPAHDEMEWHHILPQCLFKGHGPGQWLLLKQHAIATALQTLAFGHNCLCPWHVKYLPDWLWEMCRPYRVSMSSKTGKKLTEEGHMKKMRDCVDIEIHREAARIVGNNHVKSGHLDRIRDLRDPEKLVENARKLGEIHGQRAKDSGQWDSIKTLGAAAQHKQRWVNLAQGYPSYESTPCGLSKWQIVRGIDHKDPNNRRRVS